MATKDTLTISFKLIDDADGLKKLTMDADGFRKILAEGVKTADEFQQSIYKAAAVTTTLSNAANAVQQLNGFMQNLTAESLDFDKAMRSANTMAGKDSAGFQQLKGEVADLAKQIPIARDQLANGLYQVVSNGVPEDNWISFLETSAKSAVGGIADINKVVGVTSTLIKNYGLEWNAAAEIQDKIQLTAKNGVTSFEQLAQALPRVAGNAATLGVSINELMGTFATLTGVSGNTAEVSTQLAAIFTALVKPSSEAAEMAAKMGIQFDAAAIQAAGGFQAFLQQLNGSVRAYSQATGTLEQEVYGKLFGSAEALRALIPLQGELADKFTTNVSGMANSAGTMSAAFEEMGSTSDATTQQLKNQFAVFTDMIAKITSGIQPYMSFGAELLNTGASAGILAMSFKQLNVQQAILAVRAKSVNMLIWLVGLTSKKTRMGLEMLAISGGKAAAGMAAVKIALRGLLIASGVGVAIWGLTSVIEYFCSASDKATESVEKIDDATDDYTQAASAAKVQIESDIKALGELISAKKDTKEAVQQLNEKYGELFGSHEEATEWYNILMGKSRQYIKQMGYEARAKSLTAKIAEASINKELAAERKAELERAGKRTKQKAALLSRQNPYTGETNFEYVNIEVKTDEYIQAEKDLADAEATEATLQKELDTLSEAYKKNNKELNRGLTKSNEQVKVSEMTWQQCADAIDANDKALKNTTDQKRISELKAQNAQLLKRKKLMESKTGIGSARTGKKKALVSDPKTKSDLQNNIDILSKKFTGEDTPEQKKILKDLALYEKKLKAIELVEAAAKRPTELNTLKDISDELKYQNALRETATDEDRAGIDAEIKRLEELRTKKERAGHTPVPVDKLESYAQLNDEVSYYEWLVQNGTEQERIFAQQHINDLANVKKAWDDVLTDLKKPGDISTLDTIEKLDEAISYYQEQQKKASADEVKNIQETINALERKRKVLMLGTELPAMQEEAEEINSLTGEDFLIKIKGIGFENLTSKIKDLQKLLDDTENPLTEQQRNDVEDLIATYKKWRKECVMTFDSFRKGYDSLKSIGSGVESITGALEGNGNAWQTVTGIVDGFLQMYDGVKTIVDIINELILATNILTESKIAEAGATGTATAATVAGATASTAAATQEVTAATEVATAKVEEAAAKTMAAHAGIPWVGIAIAGGMVAAMTAVMLGLPKFANGGIVSGPTVGLIGEYAGASRNPEVVAPLDRLRELMGSDDDRTPRVVKFKIEGRTLVGIMEKELNFNKRR